MQLIHFLLRCAFLASVATAFPTLERNFREDGVVSVAPYKETLFKRVDIDTDGTPSESEVQQLKYDLDFCIKMAQSIVDNVHRNHAIYLRFYGSPEYFDDVMRIHQRIADLGNSDTIMTFRFNDDSGPDRPSGTLAASYRNQNNHPSFTLYRGFRGANSQDFSNDLNYVIVQRQANNLLTRLRNSRAGILYHELAHWAGDPNLFGPVLPELPFEIAGSTRNAITDPYMTNAVDLRNDNDLDLWMGQTPPLQNEEQAYGPRNVLLLPQFTQGPVFSALNADTYSMFAMALFASWLPTEEPPTVPPPQYHEANFEDPLDWAPIPNFISAFLLTNARVIWRGYRHSEL